LCLGLDFFLGVASVIGVDHGRGALERPPGSELDVARLGCLKHRGIHVELLSVCIQAIDRRDVLLSHHHLFSSKSIACCTKDMFRCRFFEAPLQFLTGGFSS